jgi:homospermidine synthase
MSLTASGLKSKTVCLDKKFVFLGCGSVGKASICFLQEFFEIDYTNVYIIDEIDMKDVPCLQDIFKKGANFMKIRLEDDDYEPLFKLLKLRPFDFVIDLTTNTNCFKLVETCKLKSLLYLNTSLEINWHFNEDSTAYDESLLKRHDVIDKIVEKTQGSATQILEFGMNPGLISHFVLQALMDISALVLKNKEDRELQKYVQNKEYAKIARHLGVEIMHCSEIDTQVVKNLVDNDVFINTWSCIGLLEEGLEPAQGGWGTHEKSLPENFDFIGKNSFAIKTPSYLKTHKSYVPDEEIVGVVIPHGEAVTLTKFFTLPDYCPTIHYVYRLCPQTRAILNKTTFEELKRVDNWRVVDPFTDELEGEDRVGALLVLNKDPITGENKNWSYWYGSILGQGMSKMFGPTVIQVAAGVLSGVKYALENPEKGILYSEDLPSDWIMENAKPYLGTVFSGPVPWSPESTQFVDLEIKPEIK